MKPVNIVLGRFQPFTLGHIACVKQAYSETGLDTVLCIIETPENKVDERHPFATKDIIPMIDPLFGEDNLLDYVLVKNADIAKIAEALHSKGYELASWACGTDRYPAYSRQCKGYWEKVGLPEEPKCIEVKRGDDDVSATKVRQAIKDGDFNSYKKLVPQPWAGQLTFKKFQSLMSKVTEDVGNQNKYGKMKPLAKYILEAIGGEYFQFELEDLEQWDIWQPNDDITKKECMAIANAFYKNWPADMNDCGTINGYSVKCEYRRSTILFTVFVKSTGVNSYRRDPINNEVVDVVEEIVNMLTNTVYSVGPGKDAKQLIKAMLNKI